MASASTPKYAAKSTIRSLKNFSKGYSEIQVKVRTATSNDPWGPSGAQMNELARASFGQQEFLEIMDILDKRLNDKGKNWRHVFKALTVLDYLLHVGSENVVKYAKDNIYIVKTLKEFQYIDEEGKDQGSNVRQKAKDITALLADDARLREERRSRNAMRDRMSGRVPGDDPYNTSTPVYQNPGAGDDDRDLQRALEESRRMARDMESSRTSEDDDLKKALELSEKEEQDRIKTVEKYNELSLTEDWEADSKPVNLYEQQQNNNNIDFFGNDFGNQSNNNNFDMFGSINNDNGYLQQQPTGFNNPYLQFQQQQLQQQQLQQQQLMQQQMLQQQQLQQQQQQMYMNSMNNPYQQQLMPQMTGAPSIGSNNPFSAFAQKPAMTGQPFSVQNGQNNASLNSNINNNNNIGNSNNNPLDDLAFLQNTMTSGTPTTTQGQSATKVNPNDEKYASLATALSNRDDGMDTFGNTGQLRIPTYNSFTSYGLSRTGTTGGASNPFQNMAGNAANGGNNSNNSNSLIDIGDNTGGGLGRSNTATNPFSQAGGGGGGGGGGYNSNSLLSPQNGMSNNFLTSQPTGFGTSNGFNNSSQFSSGSSHQNGAYTGNTLF
ncbi:hypothetical protein BG004_008252 [Podila humilis]|nr:hypothetical protein BG004_008252 [Podila humilis]